MAVPEGPKWFTPARLLVIFCFTNIMVYLDRGVIASNGVNGSPRTELLPQGSGIQGAFNLSNFEDGLLATAFLVGLLLASPVFSEACKRHSAFKLIAIGMGAWTLATLGCGLSTGFVTLLLARMLVGVGEASFVALASPFIDDYAPPEKKARWFATFYLCIPAGFASGYIFGGVVSAHSGWRAPFIVESCLMVPFVVLMALSKPLHLHGTHDRPSDREADAPPKTVREMVGEFASDVAQVASHRVWATMCLAYTLYTAVLGVYAYWGPKAGAHIYAMSGEQADLVFGAVTVITGILGSLSGGITLDLVGSSLRNANLLCGASILIGFAFVMICFLASRTFSTFMVLLAFGEFFLFFLQAPVGAIGMWSVPPVLRPLAISLVTCAIHIGGDVPSPPLLGWLETWLEARVSDPLEKEQQWRYSMSIVSLLLVLSGITFLVSGLSSHEHVDYRKAPSEAGDSSMDQQVDEQPLLLDGRRSSSPLTPEEQEAERPATDPERG